MSHSDLHVNIFASMRKITAWKVSKYRVFSSRYFPAFGLNTEQKILCIWTLFTRWMWINLFVVIWSLTSFKKIFQFNVPVKWKKNDQEWITEFWKFPSLNEITDFDSPSYNQEYKDNSPNRQKWIITHENMLSYTNPKNLTLYANKKMLPPVSIVVKIPSTITAIFMSQQQTRVNIFSYFYSILLYPM